MGNKDKTVSFRMNEETWEELSELAEERDLSLSSVFREYADTFVSHDGQVRVVGEDGVDDPDADYPPTVEVPKDFIREHERLEMENEYLELEIEHLREQLDEQQEYIGLLQERLENDEEDVVHLDDLDGEIDEGEETFRIG